MTLLAPSKEGFEALLRLARSSVAEPPSFAALVDATEDEESVTTANAE
jgi:hypothetical protein